MSKPVDTAGPETTFLERAPKLSKRGLTITLAIMCTVPVVTILFLWWALPPVFEDELPADLRLEGTPPAGYYEIKKSERTPHHGALLIVRNTGDQDWTNLIIRVNRYFMAYEKDNPLKAGEERAFQLGRFQTRTSAFFDLRFYPVRNVEVYARLPSGARATFEQDFELGQTD